MYNNMDKPSQQSAYLTLINKCHEVINDISAKTSIIQHEVCEDVRKDSNINNSALDRELQGLLAHLTELNDNLFV